MNKLFRSESGEELRRLGPKEIADMLYAQAGGMTVDDIVKTIFQATLLARLPVDTLLSKQQLLESLCEVFQVSPEDVQQIFLRDLRDFSKLPEDGPYVIVPSSSLGYCYVSQKGVNNPGKIHGYALGLAVVRYEGHERGIYFNTLIYPSDRGFTAHDDASVDDKAVLKSLLPITIQSPLSADAILELQSRERAKIEKVVQDRKAEEKKFRLTKVDTFARYDVYTTRLVQPREIASWGCDDGKKCYITIHPDAYRILRKRPEYLKIIYAHEREHIGEVRFGKSGPEHGKDNYILEFLRANGYDFGD